MTMERDQSAIRTLYRRVAAARGTQESAPEAPDRNRSSENVGAFRVRRRPRIPGVA